MFNLQTKKWSKLVLILILFFAFLTRFWRLNLPDRYIFDEVYHAVTAKLIAENDPRAFEWWHSAPEPDTAIDWLHPPLAKYTQALFINLFGYNTLGWRFSSALFGVGVVFLVYQLAEEIFERRSLSLLAAFLASLDGLLLAQSRIAMNDIHVTFFILLTLVLYWHWLKLKDSDLDKWWWLLLVGFAAGLSLASKWSGAFVVASLWFLTVWEWLSAWLNKKLDWKSWLQDFGLRFLSLALIPALVYLASYGQMFLQGHDWSHFAELHQKIWGYQTSLEATHPRQSRPLEWFLNLKPVWFHVDYVSDEQIANIYALGNPLLFWFGAASVVWTMLYLLYQLGMGVTKRHVFNQDELNLTKLSLVYFLVWLPWIFSPRIMFFYHYTPAIALLVIILAYWLMKLPKKLRYGLVALVVIVFIIWYPNWVGLPVSRQFADRVYFLIKSWR